MSVCWWLPAGPCRACAEVFAELGPGGMGSHLSASSAASCKTRLLVCQNTVVNKRVCCILMPFRFSMYEPVSFMRLFFEPYLEFEQKKEHVALHVPCTSKQAGLTDNFVALAERCSKQVSLTGVGFVWRVWQGSGERRARRLDGGHHEHCHSHTI